MIRQLRLSRHAIRSVVPAIWSWSTYRSAVLNVLAFGLVALAAMWLVHQTEYAIEYGSRFSAVMAATPHHLYMDQLGAFLAALTGILTVAVCGILVQNRRAISRLLPLVPARLLRHTSAPLPCWNAGVVLQTACAMALFQIVLYVIQENLESVAVGAVFPGLAVIFAPQHLTVIPLHLLAALGGSFLLWLLATVLRQTRSTLRMTRALAGIGACRQAIAVISAPPAVRLPTPAVFAGRRSLRSPPRPA